MAPRSRTSQSTSGSSTPPAIVSRTKHGNHTRYQISDPDVFDLCDQVCGSVRRQIGELEAILHSTP